MRGAIAIRAHTIRAPICGTCSRRMSGWRQPSLPFTMTAFIVRMVDDARAAIADGTYFEYRDEFLGNYYSGKKP